jgi:hypothetical protein
LDEVFKIWGDLLFLLSIIILSCLFLFLDFIYGPYIAK